MLNKFTNRLRYFIELSYNGKTFHGWQSQLNAKSVQETIENSLQILLKDKNLKIIGAGRTDTGVHAIQIFAHFDHKELIDIDDLVFKINSFINKNIVVKGIMMVSDNAHARFDALSREYKYFITQTKDVYNFHTKYFFSKKLNFVEINKAIDILKQTKNFKSFCKTKTDVNNYNCEIFHFECNVNGSDIIFTIRANRFLRNMVRSIIGTILDIGIGKISVKILPEIIEKSNRIFAGPSVPAHGLFLSNIEYPEKIFLNE